MFALNTTPERLRLFLVGSWLLAGVLGLVVMVGAYDHRAAVASIRGADRDGEPHGGKCNAARR